MNFSCSHPLVLFLYFIIMICFGFINRSPEFLLISFIGAFGYKRVRHKKRKVKYELILYASIVLLFTVVNMLFSHNGEGILFFINDNPITKQSAYSGACMGIALSTGLCWLSSMCDMMSGEKITYLLSKVSPKLAVFTSRLMKALPLARVKFRSIYKVQKTIYSGAERKFKKSYVICRSLSATITWMIEDAADVSDSMYARGFALSHHSSFSKFSFKKWDIVMLIGFALSVFLISASMILDIVGIYFYPVLGYPKISVIYVMVLILWIILSTIPFISKICEEYKWKLLKSKI